MPIHTDKKQFLTKPLSIKVSIIFLLAGSIQVNAINTPAEDTDTKPLESPLNTAEPTTPSTTPAKAENKPATKSKPTSKFKPSEEISEDFSVPFPVDI